VVSCCSPLLYSLFRAFINIRGFTAAIDIVRGRHAKSSDPGEITHFQALSTAISGTVGVGNIGGVAVAISIGGPGAAFWLFVAGFLAMSTKFVECTLGVKYRRYNEDGSVSGGPMYYLEHFLESRAFQALENYWAVSTPSPLLLVVLVLAICSSQIRRMCKC
jgi:AGCS family alanine or glycine:cation symporter